MAAGTLCEKSGGATRRATRGFHATRQLCYYLPFPINPAPGRLTMAEYCAQLLWLRGEQDFLANRYSRRHLLRFDGGLEIPASSSPHVVPVPMSDPAAVDPEEAFVASLASCHMLWFLSIAARRGFCVDRYADSPVGVMAKNSDGKLAITVVTLKPEVAFAGNRAPGREDVMQMHQQAHAECFIANSVKSEVRCEPVFATSPD
ncbi:MAG: OsmC-like protein [Candidatus Accumulibacter regalis]|jgi:organic hydroperoxide reductase OsmC/OhrA|uniref:OsmC-like protein n=2 Tax=Candidatus Accumulibacter TaxID=327159 RepID=A0A011P907_ACCRE|nr:MAG: OsmC-like protein [Candidatus Accumulibacter regalis]